jgi:P27 family predicted phage terminase small subunit
MPNKRAPSPPAHLSGESRALWRSVLKDYELEDRHQIVLTGALEALDRMRQAQAAIEADGAFTPDRWGQMKAHPAIAVERDSRIAVARGLRELGLDLEAPATSRPPTRWRPS